jgi:hypothetical protein
MNSPCARVIVRPVPPAQHATRTVGIRRKSHWGRPATLTRRGLPRRASKVAPWSPESRVMAMAAIATLGAASRCHQLHRLRERRWEFGPSRSASTPQSNAADFESASSHPRPDTSRHGCVTDHQADEHWTLRRADRAADHDAAALRRDRTAASCRGRSRPGLPPLPADSAVTAGLIRPLRALDVTIGEVIELLEAIGDPDRLADGRPGPTGR